MTQYRLQLEGFSQYAAKYAWLNNPFSFWLYGYYFKRSR